MKKNCKYNKFIFFEITKDKNKVLKYSYCTQCPLYQRLDTKTLFIKD